MRPLLGTAVVVLLLGLTACSQTDAPAESSAPEADRFQVTFNETTELLATLDAGQLTDADSANAAYDLSADSPLHYNDISATSNGGRWCLVSDDDTWISLVYGDGKSFMRLGDGECGYTDADASVVGDHLDGAWTKGADLMGDVELTYAPQAG